MTEEKRIILNGESHIVVISDEPEALLAAKAAGRAVVAVDASLGTAAMAGSEDALSMAGSKDIPGLPGEALRGVSYAVPDFADATEELAELVLRRHLGLPWQIGETERLILRELAAEDAEHIPEEEYGAEEKIFRSRELLERYIKNQYGFYEYGIWAVVEKHTGCLAGLAGVSNPNLPPEAEAVLAAAGENGPDACPWLELGYHIFRPFRRMGYGREAVREAADYAQEVLDVGLCALIHRDNKASRCLAEGLGMVPIAEIDTGLSAGHLLYVKNRK